MLLSYGVSDYQSILLFTCKFQVQQAACYFLLALVTDYCTYTHTHVGTHALTRTHTHTHDMLNVVKVTCSVL